MMSEKETIAKIVEILLPDIKERDIKTYLERQGISPFIAKMVVSWINSKGGIKNIINEIIIEQNPKILEIYIREIGTIISEYAGEKQKGKG